MRRGIAGSAIEVEMSVEQSESKAQMLAQGPSGDLAILVAAWREIDGVCCGDVSSKGETFLGGEAWRHVHG